MRSILHSLKLPLLIPQLRTSWMALLNRSDSDCAALDARAEFIRQLMLIELGEYGEKTFPAAVRRVRYASDVQALWYARSDIMAILASAHGETVAREKMVQISERFKGLLPKSLTEKSVFKNRQSH